MGDVFDKLSSGTPSQSSAAGIGDVFDKLSSGGTTTKEALQNYAPPVPRPQVKMQESLLAPSAVASQPDKELTSLSQSGEGYASDEGASAAMSTAGVGALATMIGVKGIQAMAGTALGRAILVQAGKGALHAAGAGSVYGIGKKLGWWSNEGK